MPLISEEKGNRKKERRTYSTEGSGDSTCDPHGHGHPEIKAVHCVDTEGKCYW
jgi:hypothetical protein